MSAPRADFESARAVIEAQGGVVLTAEQALDLNAMFYRSLCAAQKVEREAKDGRELMTKLSNGWRFAPRDPKGQP